jgi:predicted GTPase
MPYGDLRRQAVQRFQKPGDLDAADCTIEEREEYEPYLALGVPVYAGVDYARVLALAQEKADFILWDGGNNDFPFVRPDLHIVLLDPHRPGHELAYHPGETNFRMANLFIITKADSAPAEGLRQVQESIRRYRPRTPTVLADLAITVDRPDLVRGKRVLVVEDGPTLTHGGVPWGAGALAARQLGAALVDPRPWAQGSLKELFAAYPHIGPALPAVGYSPAQVRELEATVRAVPCDAVVDATPVSLSRLLKVPQPLVQVEYELRERGPGLEQALERFARRFHLAPR